MKTDPSPKFHDLGEPIGESTPLKSSKASKKWYPSLRLRTKARGLAKVGKRGTARIKYRVHSVSVRDNGLPEVEMDVTHIEG